MPIHIRLPVPGLSYLLDAVPGRSARGRFLVAYGKRYPIAYDHHNVSKAYSPQKRNPRRNRRPRQSILLCETSTTRSWTPIRHKPTDCEMNNREHLPRASLKSTPKAVGVTRLPARKWVSYMRSDKHDCGCKCRKTTEKRWFWDHLTQQAVTLI